MYINQNSLLKCPQAVSIISGSENYSSIKGIVKFYKVTNGTVIISEISGLPHNGFFAMHIHNGKACTGNSEEYFADAGTHLNFTDEKHPFHTGDLPALLSNAGYAWSAIYSNRFIPSQIIGFPIIIHKNPDDFVTQPSGNAGEKIACGIIRVSHC